MEADVPVQDYHVVPSTSTRVATGMRKSLVGVLVRCRSTLAWTARGTSLVNLGSAPNAQDQPCHGCGALSRDSLTRVACQNKRGTAETPDGSTAAVASRIARLRIMAPSRKETTIGLCKKVNAQGNTVSIRMLEYLSSSKEPVRGFISLATTFLDLARLVWSIEAGIEESFKSRKTYPVEITQDLDVRFRRIHEEFVTLGQMVSKFIDNGNGKGGLGKRMRMMFADSEVEKERLTLLKSCESLKMSSAIFRWTIGDEHADETMAIGYAGLIAALERIKPTTPSLSSQNRGSPQSSQPPAPTTKSDHGNTENLLPPPHLGRKSSLNAYRPNGNDSAYSTGVHSTLSDLVFQHEELRMSPDIPHLHNDWRASSVRSGGSVREHIIPSPSMSHERHLDTHHAPYEEHDWSRMPVKQHGDQPETPQQRYPHNSYTTHRHTDNHDMPTHSSGSYRSAGGKDGIAMAVRQGQYRMVERLLSSGVELDATASARLLRIAIDSRDPSTVSVLLRHGADANDVDGEGHTPLFAATKAASVDCARILLKSGADANFKDNEGTTALFKAIQGGHVDVMAVLLDHGADANLPCPKHPLWPSCYHPEALSLLLSRGADHKRTPGIMELAASLKKLDSVKILINAGVSPNVRKDGAYTPLASAIRDNSADIVTYLLEHGADPNMKASLQVQTYTPRRASSKLPSFTKTKTLSSTSSTKA
ncbi:hypothetical protein OPT61_g8701 [Boeremia exigua]|uniref:Uncharacterized protein n=1 Tax=Boeremia exigua TaxID=749465 RepID=A0ACC2HXD3_9PLEO|nr:hypothetical protein OPT61_g8701 [Boeremia exigua]